MGAIAGFAAIISGKIFLGTGIGLWGSLILGALVGLGCGIGNGLLVTVGRVNAFMATLATSIIIYGFAQVVTSGNLVSVQTERFSTLGLGNAWGINYPIFVWVGFALVVRLPPLADDLRPLRVRGRRQCGGRPSLRRPRQRRSAPRPSPSPASPRGIAGVILFSEVSTAQWNANSGIEFDAITAIVLGGTSLFGGEGAIWRDRPRRVLPA